MGDSFNHLMDNLIAATWRIMDLPMYVLVIFFVVLYFILRWLIKKFLKGDQKTLKFILPIMGLFLMAFIVDHKISLMKQEIELVNEKYLNFQQAETLKLWDKEFDIEAISKEFGQELLADQRYVNEATKLFILKKEDPKAVIFLAITDLAHPGLEVVITPEHKEKYLTSRFAKENNCYLAINGEAGETPYPGGPLGQFTGNWITDGKAILLEDTELRPFMSFDKENVGRYFKAPIVDTVNTEEKYNTIWGRFDILLKGKVQADPRNRAYSRTIMGLDTNGRYLYTMVVDGKRPQYSLGLTKIEAAELLKLFGAHNVMSCDQGGSSCMYVKNHKGIINRPADSDGYERPVYSHFGLRMKN
ncbi:MAG: phosphodiester glycosidase family protein [Flavobacteriales bacterium]|nr:phosphodiester glycosidase family protein [Flavobacteriales bacterium]